MTPKETCELFKIIPKEEINRVFSESDTIGAECDFTFLGFEEVYKSVLNFVPKSRIIVDLGCAYAPQAYYFTDYRKYIGVDNGGIDVHFQTENMEYYHESIQTFISKLAERDINVNDCFAICSYVPDDNASRLVRQTFPNLLVYYPKQ